jgi:hypothetical protein
VTEQRPSVGRIVHYTAPGSGDGVYPRICRAAIVTEVTQPDSPKGFVNLMVLNPTGVHFRLEVPQDRNGSAPGNESYTWHWPERTP